MLLLLLNLIDLMNVCYIPQVYVQFYPNEILKDFAKEIRRNYLSGKLNSKYYETFRPELFEFLDKVNSGTVIITAHGVGSNIYDKIKSENAIAVFEGNVIEGEEQITKADCQISKIYYKNENKIVQK